MPRLDLIYRLQAHVMPTGISLVAVDALLALLFLVLLLAFLRSRTRIPPGPAGLPLVGVTLQIPSDKQWLKFHEWILRYAWIHVHQNCRNETMTNNERLF
ncbi:hypothetical protein C8Q76DRAFT_61362 [Earliella scabrosa]|nr:hypothetical protein C8Q76DRAFT_61362 [Earliella scabrosa]